MILRQESSLPAIKIMSFNSQDVENHKSEDAQKFRIVSFKNKEKVAWHDSDSISFVNVNFKRWIEWFLENAIILLKL